MNKILTLVLCAFSLQSFGQVSDSFTDGDFTINPVWSPDIITNWTITNIQGNNQLRSNSTTASTTFYITTPSTRALNAQWEFYLNLQFNTSSANFVDVYLTSDQSNLTSSTNNGYFIRIGGTPDEISLYKLTNGVASILINGADGVTNVSNSTIRIKVTRDSNNLWTLQRDTGGTGNNYVSELSITDNSFSTSSFFGFKITQSTATFHQKHFFDDIYVGDIIVESVPPTVQSIQANSSSELTLTFSEALENTSAQQLINYSVNNGIGNPAAAVLQPDQKTVKLTFATPFTNGVENQLSVSGVKDLAGNSIVATSQNFLYFVAQPAAYNDIVINELLPDPSPQIGLPASEFVEIYNRSTKPFDLLNWKLSDPSTTANLPAQILLPGEYLIITGTAAVSSFMPFGKVIGLSNFPTLNNSGDAIKLVDATGLKIDSVNYDLVWYQDPDKEQGGWTLERLNPAVNGNDPTNWQSSVDASGGTPGKQNSVFGKNPDSKPPQLLALTVLTQHQLSLDFSEALDPAKATTIANYSVSNLIGNPVSAVLSNDGKSVTLDFASPFQNGMDNVLIVSGVTDLAGNVMSATEKIFRYFLATAVKFNDIVINEIMADPLPIVQLPEAEFIEIHNTTDNPFDVGGWKLSDATSTTSLPSQIILPKDYLILTANSNVSKFTSFGKVLSVTSFPSLNNTGEALVIRSASGVLIDSVNYSPSWYQDVEKEQGGWTLERLNSAVNSNEATNWQASVDVSGGTPGKQNSVFGKNPDSKAPVLLSIAVATQKQLVLLFSEAVDLATATTVTNYAANNGIGNPMVAVPSADKKVVTLTFESNFQNGVDNLLTTSGIKDEAGNLMVTTEKPFRFLLTSPVKFKDVIITEIMADPTPVVQLPEAEYIEIYNKTQGPFDVGGWRLSDATSTATLSSQIILPNEYLILTSTSNAAKFSTFGKVVAVSSFPSLNNSGEALALRTATGILIDSVNYNTDWYQDRDKQDGGWSLEIIDLNNACGEGENWIASESAIGGTPGKINSVNANKPDITGPKLLAVVAEADQQLELIFNEKLEKPLSGIAFECSPAATVSSYTFSDLSLKQIKLDLVQPLAQRQLYSVTVKNLRDCAGNFIDENFNKLEFALTENIDSLDIVVNEILFNPRTGGVDFVELYNRSLKFLNLKELSIANRKEGIIENSKVITIENFILRPNSYLALTTDPQLLKSQYPSSDDLLFYKSALPSMPDDEGSVAIHVNGKVIDFFHYRDDYHSPLLKDDEGVSLERISFSAPTNDRSNWASATATAGYATPGQINSNSKPESFTDENAVVIEPEIFIPSIDFAKINYKFDQSNFIANVKIVDSQGRLIKEVANNQSLSYEGFFRWDGDQTDGSKARMGYYTVWVEVFDLTGTVKTFRKRVVISSN